MFGHSGREREKLQPRPEYVQRANNESSYNRRATEKKNRRVESVIIFQMLWRLWSARTTLNRYGTGCVNG